MKNETVEDIALDSICARCNAEPQQWCTTSSGARASYLHSARIDPVRRGEGAGYLLGLRDQQMTLERYFTNFFASDGDMRIGRNEVMAILTEGRKAYR